MNSINRTSYYLKPAEFCFTSEPAIIKTTLGSCLTITMYSRKTGAAAACHAVLPACKEENCSCDVDSCRQKYKYVECVIPEMLRRFRQLGVSPDEIEIKMFGGADLLIFRKGCRSWENQRVGRKNILKAREMTHYYDLTLSGTDVGGTLGRKLYFDTETGHVWLKRLARISQPLAEAT